MPLTAGSRLGPYEIVAPLGAGGMGEVYRARDARLGREVAIKVLPAAFASDPDRVARFEREAKVLASLNHPNIAAIYGLEASSSTVALVMELVEGPTLADRIAGGPVALDEALSIGRQIAEAFEAAHDAGVVHRDLKPANVKVKPDGIVKVLDFGLARIVEPATSDVSAVLPESPTVTSPSPGHSPTIPGVILGTAAYMSPEQARGKSVDKRTDVWSFGCVLYEMLAGKQAFEGETVSDLMAAVLRAEPDWTRLPEETPYQVRRLIERCLRKDAKTRLRDMGDARLELIEAASGEGAMAAPPVAARRGITLPVWAMTALAVMLVAAGGLAGARLLVRPSPAGPSLLLSQPLEAGLSMSKLSPDGIRLACSRQSAGRSSLTVLDLRDGSRRDFPEVTDVGVVFWSPDSRELAVLRRGDLDAVNLSTGVVRRICSLESTVRNGGTWSADRGILLASNGRLFRVPSSGGTPEPVVRPDSTSDTTGVRAPYFLPDGKTFLIGRTWGRDGGASSMGIELRTIDGKRRTLISGTEGIWEFGYQQGYLICINEGALLAQWLDLKEGRLAGEPDRLVVESVSRFSVSRDGVLLYERREESPPGRITWLDRNGRRLQQIGEPRSVGTIELGPAGNQALVSDFKAGLLLLDLERGVATGLNLAKEEFGGYPLWSRDGRFVYFSRGSLGALDIWRRRLDGPHSPERVIGLGKILFPGDLAPGDSILVGYTTEGEIYLVHLEATPRTEIYAHVHDFVGRPRVSPDGRWLLYASHETGEFEVYINSFPRPGTPFRISPDGGRQPRWRGDGREIVYVCPDSTMMSVECVLGPTPKFGSVQPLFRVPFDPMAARFDMTPDAQRFLVLAAESTKVAVPEVKVLVNWTARLEEK